tara:strand:- start:6839 stop:7993 length:1155 start_codon:yes stop_codon:yes gene_type:complete
MSKFYKYFLILLPTVVILQPLLPFLLAQVFLIFKLILIPVIILYYLGTPKNIIWFYFIILHLVGLLAIYQPSNLYQYFINFLCIFSSIPLFILGKHLVKSNYNLSNFKYLVYGTNIFNIITLGLLLLVTIGYVDISQVYEPLGRGDDVWLGSWRFSLGNAIETPFIATIFLFAGILLTKRENKSAVFVASTLLNFTVSLISQSRVVIAISLLLFLYQLTKVSMIKKIMIVSLITSIVLSAGVFINEIGLSLLDRLSGNDYGSTDQRLRFVNIISENLFENNFLIGNGLTSSYDLNLEKFGRYQTGESVLLELIYDTGILGAFLIFIPVLKNNLKSLLKGEYRLALLFVYIQVMFLLPLFSSMMFVFFIFGINSWGPKKINAIGM